MDIVLIPGLWLDGSAWGLVASLLESSGHRPVPLTLPGQGDGSRSATLQDQLNVVLAAVDACTGLPLVVGHSAASAIAWMAADARPEKVGRVAMIGGFPLADGQRYADFELQGGVAPFPGWSVFEGPDSDDLDEKARADFVAAAVAVPEGVIKGVVHLSDERRFEVPVTLICPEFSPAQAMEWVDSAEVPELARARRVEYVDIDSGHWPMVTRAAELARLLGELAAV